MTLEEAKAVLQSLSVMQGVLVMLVNIMVPEVRCLEEELEEEKAKGVKL